MDARKIALLVGALFVAAITAFMARSLMSGAGAPPAGAAATVQPVGPEVLVATKPLPVGTILDASALKFTPWPKDLVENAYYLKTDTNISALQGTVVRTAISAGQPVTQGALVKPGDRGFLAAALGPGMRAVTVPVSDQTSVGGFIFPGDRVDLVLTQTVPGGGDGPPLKAAETVVRNMRVLATDQRTDNAVGPDGKAQVHSFRNVTLEVTPKIAEEIAVAQTVGSLSLSLRSIADNGEQLEEAIASGAVKVPNDPAAEKAMMLEVASHPLGGPASVTTGADVSHFQRSTVPAKPVDRSAAPVVVASSGGNGNSGNGNPAFPGGAAGPMGPVVRISRGDAVTFVAVGKN